MVTAIVLANTSGCAVGDAAQKLAGMEGVSQVYSVAGPYDLIATIEAKDDEEMARLVTEHMMELDAIETAITLLAVEMHGRRDLAHTYSIGSGTN